ncbi:MAG: HD-GYP domain-containing protein [Bacteriovoracia bacterium]
MKKETAPRMTAENIHVPESFFSVDIEKFRYATRDISFDIYLRLSEANFAHVFSRTTGLDYKRLAQYIQKGVKEVFIKLDDRGKFEEFIAKTADVVFQNPETSNEHKIAILLNMTEQNMTELFTQLDVPNETAENTRRVIHHYVELMGESSNTLDILLKLASHGDYLYYHSIATAIFSMFIAKATGQFNRRTLEIVGLGGFLHDIGETQLPKEVTEAMRDLTPTEWKEMRTHPKLGLRMIENTPSVPDEVRYIVYQHHEEPSGNGYPNGLKNNVIYYPAKIVAIADAFSALISRRPFRPAYTVEQAIHIIQSEVGKYDRQLVQLLDAVFHRGSKAA